MTRKRPGIKRMMPEGATNAVGLVQHQGELYAAFDNGIYKLVSGKWEAVIMADSIHGMAFEVVSSK